MKLFYFGSVCSSEIFDETVAKSKVKPSASAQNFETALIKGFSENEGIEVEVASAESIAMFPSGNRLFLEKRRDVLAEKCFANVIPAINLPFLKQVGHANGAARLLKKWLKENENEQEKCVLVYGLYPSVVQKLLHVCRAHGCKIFALITDVPSTMFTYTKSKNLLKRFFSGAYRELAISLQDQFDGYVYLTEAMKDEVAPGKPYVVIETIADTKIFDSVGLVERSNPPALMYAGALYKKYGVDLIVDAFECTKSECELWLFGSGDYEHEIIERTGRIPRIRFFGRVSREEVLRREKEASLLLNIRNADDIYTKFSFPSKMVEYMLSGTPLLTTRLDGIPEEYYSYCHTVSERDAGKIAEKIDKILSKQNESTIGEEAQRFVREQKNAQNQAGKILEFLNRII